MFSIDCFYNSLNYFWICYKYFWKSFSIYKGELLKKETEQQQKAFLSNRVQ